MGEIALGRISHGTIAIVGLLILVTRPFRIGDQIIYGNYEAT